MVFQLLSGLLRPHQTRAQLWTPMDASLRGMSLKQTNTSAHMVCHRRMKNPGNCEDPQTHEVARWIFLRIFPGLLTGPGTHRGLSFI